MTRWVALALGIAITGVALYLLVGGGSPRAPGRDSVDIDDASRARLEDVLEQADREEGAQL